MLWFPECRSWVPLQCVSSLQWHIQRHLSQDTPTVSMHLLQVSRTGQRLLRCLLAQWDEPACEGVRNRAEKKDGCDPKMPKLIVNTNINKDKVPESFAGISPNNSQKH